jgi:hypothetical protein
MLYLGFPCDALFGWYRDDNVSYVVLSRNWRWKGWTIMKMNVKVEFEIEGDEAPNDMELKEMIYSYLSEAIEAEELDYSAEVADDDTLN